MFQAQLVSNNREVAVKTCRDPDTLRDKFLDEADTLKKFNHKNVVKLLGKLIMINSLFFSIQ